MVISVRDARFGERPHYKPEELDRACETIITGFLKDTYGESHYPLTTDDLTKLIERDAESLDLYADLSGYGSDVEGVTEFNPGHKPRVLIAEALQDPGRENRLRTTLTHEYGHVHFHAYLWDVAAATGSLLQHAHADKGICKRDGIMQATEGNWMEWQAGYVCGALLMPKTVFLKLFAAFGSTRGLEGALSEQSPHATAWFNECAEAFQVSTDAARIRSLKLGLILAGPPRPTLF
jgi:hypothetical protein